jgi:hypothetical protein
LQLSDEDIAAGFTVSITGDMADGCLSVDGKVWYEKPFPTPDASENEPATVYGNPPNGDRVESSDPAEILPFVVDPTPPPVPAPTPAPVPGPTPAPQIDVITRAPVEPKEPDDEPPQPGCAPMGSATMGSTYCSEQGVAVINTIPNDSAPDVSFALEDIFYDVSGGAGGETVSFQTRNPFAGQMDMYLQYSKPGEGLAENFCVAGQNVEECEAMGVGTIQAACQNMAKDPLALVTVYFVDAGASVLGAGGAEVDECCQPIVPDGASVVAYSFKIYCSCSIS